MPLSTRATPLLSWRLFSGLALACALIPGTADAQAPAPQRPTVARPTAPTAPSSRPTAPTAPTAPSSRPTAPTASPRPAPPGDLGPPPSLPDLGPPPSLPPTDAPGAPPEPGPAPSTPAPPAPSGPSPQRPTARPLATPTPAPTTIPAPTPAPTTIPAPTASEIPPPPPLAPVPSASPLDVPRRPAPPLNPAASAPAIAGADPAHEAPRPLTLADLDAIEKQRTQAERKNPKKWRHTGLVFDLQIGTAGCFRQVCRAEHHAAPGVHLGGFFGGNVLGVLELGLEAGWNTMRPRDVAGRNAINLYGLDPAALQREISEQQGIPVEVDFSTLTVRSATSRAFNIGPSLKIHFIRKGRGLAYVGAGLHYQRWRNRYETDGGDLRLDFHGIAAPFKIGGGALVHPNIAIVGEFTYSLAFYVLGGVRHPDLFAVAPLSLIESASSATTGLTGNLPHFGKFSVNLRFRF